MSANLQIGQFYGATQQRVETGGVVLSEVCHPHGRKLPQHTHESAYFGLLLAGGYTEKFALRATEYGPFTLGFHPPNFTHVDEIGACGSRMFCVEIRDSFWSSVRDYLTSPKFTPDLCGEETTWLGLRLYRSFRKGTLGNLEIEEVAAQMLERCSQSAIGTERGTPLWLGRAMELLRETFQQQVTLEGIAKNVAIHPIHLSRVFRKKYRCTMGEYVNRMRVQFVCAQMTLGWPALNALALEAGFADQSHMGRVFRSVAGETPAQMREFLHNARQNIV